jgi:hypothetical protein
MGIDAESERAGNHRAKVWGDQSTDVRPVATDRKQSRKSPLEAGPEFTAFNLKRDAVQSTVTLAA